MKKLLIIIIFMKCLCVKGQIQLSNDYKWFGSEQRFRGSGLANSTYTFYLEAERGDEEDILSNWNKTTDNLFISTGKYFYTIYIPEKHQLVTVRCKKVESKFSYYSSLLLKTVRENRYNKKTFFEKQNGEKINYKKLYPQSF